MQCQTDLVIWPINHTITSVLHVHPPLSPPHHRLPDTASVSVPTSLRRCSSLLLLPKLHTSFTHSLTHAQQHHHNTITTPTTIPTHTTMAPSKHFHQAFLLLNTLVYIMIFFRCHARVFTTALPHFELYPASSQPPRPRRAQEAFQILSCQHSILVALVNKRLHRCQPGSPAPSPLMMETATRHRVDW